MVLCIQTYKIRGALLGFSAYTKFTSKSTSALRLPNSTDIGNPRTRGGSDARPLSINIDWCIFGSGFKLHTKHSRYFIRIISETFVFVYSLRVRSFGDGRRKKP